MELKTKFKAPNDAAAARYCAALALIDNLEGTRIHRKTVVRVVTEEMGIDAQIAKAVALIARNKIASEQERAQAKFALAENLDQPIDAFAVIKDTAERFSAQELQRAKNNTGYMDADGEKELAWDSRNTIYYSALLLYRSFLAGYSVIF